MTAAAWSAPAAAPAATVPTLLNGGQVGPNLIFDGSSFESSNLQGAKLVNVSPVEYDLTIRPDTLNGRHRVWFYFSVRGARFDNEVQRQLLLSCVESGFSDHRAFEQIIRSLFMKLLGGTLGEAE